MRYLCKYTVKKWIKTRYIVLTAPLCHNKVNLCENLYKNSAASPFLKFFLNICNSLSFKTKIHVLYNHNCQNVVRKMVLIQKRRTPNWNQPYKILNCSAWNFGMFCADNWNQLCNALLKQLKPTTKKAAPRGFLPSGRQCPQL